MATTTVPTDTPNPHKEPSRRPPLWQAPVFVLGVGVLLAVWFGRPLWPDSATRRLERDLASAKTLLSRMDGDPEEALHLAQRVLETNDLAPERAAEANFLAGSACIGLAERPVEGGTPPGKTAPLWQQARQYLEIADKLGVPEDSRPALVYCLGKVGFQTGDQLARVIERLESSVAQIDNRAEGYALLTQAYLRLPKPDLNLALEANRKLRDVANATEVELANAKLIGGELLLRLGKLEEARKTLEKISDQAPAAIVSRARLLQARSYQQERNWNEAARLYQVALAERRTPLAEPANVYFNLGICYRQLDNPEAARVWQECIKHSDSPEALIAALYQAELPSIEAGQIDALNNLYGRINSAKDWNNPLLDLGGVRGSFERIAQSLRQASRYDLALRVLDTYEKVAVPGRTLVLRSEVAAEWARLRLERATKAGNTEAAKVEEQEAGKLYRLAARASAEAAATPECKPTDQVQLIWASAANYVACADYVRATEQYEQALKLESDPARQGEGWFRLGETYRSQNNITKASQAYRQSLVFSTRYAALSRFQLAMAALESGDLDEAESQLSFNLKLLRFAPDDEAMEKSLFKLGELLYQRRNYRLAIRRLEEAVSHFKENPNAPKARFQLADSYRHVAAQENQSFLLGENMTAEKKTHFQREHRRWLLKAAEEFAELDKFLDSPAGKNSLTEAQRMQVPAVTARCWFNLGEYGKALEIYERLITRYPGKVEGLDALGGAVSCHAAMGQEDKVRQRLLEITKMLTLPSIDPSIRQPWEKWVVEATRSLNRVKTD